MASPPFPPPGGARIGAHRNAVMRWELGQARPRRETLERITRACGLTAAQLADEESAGWASQDGYAEAVQHQSPPSRLPPHHPQEPKAKAAAVMYSTERPEGAWPKETRVRYTGGGRLGGTTGGWLRKGMEGQVRAWRPSRREGGSLLDVVSFVRSPHRGGEAPPLRM